jgi:hypothetical protein
VTHEPAHPRLDLRALGVQQPWLELILRGLKTLEIRSQPTRVLGTIYLYASKRWSRHPAAIAAVEQYGWNPSDLPTGQLLGTVDLVGCRPCRPQDAAAAHLPEHDLSGFWAWELARPVRLPEPLAVRFLPYGVWFYPFRRKPQGSPAFDRNASPELPADSSA